MKSSRGGTTNNHLSFIQSLVRGFSILIIILILIMQTIVLDLELTCWEQRNKEQAREIIEIGAVRLNPSLETADEFQRFVRPAIHPNLSDFCKALTCIEQKSVDSAEGFDTVFPAFMQWIGDDSYTLVTWGEPDVQYIKDDCKRHSLKFPKRFQKKHFNAKEAFSTLKGIRPCSMAQALQMLNIPLTGTNHRALDDARNVAKVLRWIRSIGR